LHDHLITLSPRFAFGRRCETGLDYGYSFIDALAGAIDKMVDVQPIAEFYDEADDDDSSIHVGHGIEGSLSDTQEEMHVVRQLLQIMEKRNLTTGLRIVEDDDGNLTYVYPRSN
jgi:hypothetical protein